MFEFPLPLEVRQRFRFTRTVTVLGLLTLAALVFSYLGAFAISDALMHADLIEPWSRDRDPRPHWMWVSFGSMSGGFCLVASLLKWTSGRQMRKLDAISNDED